MLLFPKDSLTKHYKKLGYDDLLTDLLVMDDYYYGVFDDYAPARAVCKKKPSPCVNPQASQKYQEWRENRIVILRKRIASYEPIVKEIKDEHPDGRGLDSAQSIIVSAYEDRVKELAELEKNQ